MEKSCLTPMTEVEFVGYRITNHGITPSSDKIQPILTAPKPMTLKALRSFLGFANAYRKHIPRFAELTKPLQILRDDVKKKIKKWTPEAEQAFIHLKKVMTSLPVLRLPDPDKEYILDTDASSIAVGAVLQQRDAEGNLYPIAYASRAFKGAETNWPPRDIEAFAIIWAVRHFSHYLLGRHFTIRTDHNSLRWLLESDKGRPGRWNSLLADYDCKIVYHPGKSMEHVDYISRHTMVDTLTKEILSELNYDDQNDEHVIQILNAEDEITYTEQDEGLGLEQTMNSDNDLGAFSITASELQQEQRKDHQGQTLKANNVLIHKHGLDLTQDYKQYIPGTLRRRMLEMTHTRHNQHYGIRKTLEILLQRYWWPNIRQHTKEFIASCRTCQQAKSGHERRQGLQRAIKANDAMDIVQLDIIGPLDPTEKGHKYILTAIDTFSRVAWAAPLQRANSAEVTQAFLEQWVLRWGPPRMVLTDNAAYFTCPYFAKFLTRFNTLLTHSAPWHPEGHAHIENFNRQLQQAFKPFTTITRDRVTLPACPHWLCLSTGHHHHQS
eukprot:Blabericola_migrator_1__5244@NODE_2699_length_2446_cov_19_828079_g1687_i0_p1_GENE_NODE_2699_length_2446_cov_19_828079_g1687_i0NODE_2699_length_2446_cov_19_828079_g1687_i0_p1_ORF_typecomplete_len551_score39_10RT_RNaseH_2/PF17919_1/1_2e32RT_RNaseH_2/PF17919_1/6_9e03RT_RNaseH/PF17917_1/8_5e32rve/PF00665_26/2_6e02rve/PF00665_26/1_8e22Integrase_H2C2/PF17921_1/2_4e17Integrase_H2C2/PF17921_1/1_3e04zfH2C2/PF09337_10/2_7e08DDE_2/PF02914_15/0_0043_NODE_2699_length_2446_cov_19_828079_g1687_i03421994